MKLGVRRIGPVLAVLVAGVTAGCGDSHQHPVVRHTGRVVVAPTSSLFDQPLHIVVRGVGSDRTVAVELRSVDAGGATFASRARFRSSRSGGVDLATSASTGGSYQGVDPTGLIDTLRPVSGKAALYLWGGARLQSFAVTVTENGSEVASGRFARRLMAPGVAVQDEYVAATGFYGQFWTPPPGAPRRPAVLEFGGSEGGLDGQLLAASLASAGYPTLDLAYFRAPGLPSALRDISLEYFARALRWLGHQPGVSAGRVYVSGVSRGSEAALLLGVHFPSLVHGVIASSPSSLAFGSYPSNTAAWTYHGKPVPYSQSFSNIVPIYDPAAAIPVQRIRGPVLLDCGTDDHVWTSCAYAGNIQSRLNAAHDPYPHALYRYSGAGHFVGDLVAHQPGAILPATAGHGAGNTPLANANADARLWPRVLSFVAGRGQTGTFTVPATPPALPSP